VFKSPGISPSRTDYLPSRSLAECTVPFKILFHGSLLPGDQTGKTDVAMLGQGDTAIPGHVGDLFWFRAHQNNIPLVFMFIHC
jgi:hypothetical protein